jgi:uncharacterized membrane protein
VRTERLQALADGVFAIALTLLVLELPSPSGSTDLAHDLLAQWPFYAAYAVSFATVGIVWVNHHTLLDRMARGDRAFLELNLLLLALVAVVPWPTGLLAEYVREADGSAAAAVTYGLVMTAMSAAFSAIWLRLARRPALLRPDARDRAGAAVRRSLVGPAAYAVSTLVALVSAPAAFVLYAAVALFVAVSGRRGAAVPDQDEEVSRPAAGGR